MEWLVLSLFGLMLVACIALGWSILVALAAGLGLFLGYGRLRGHGWRALGRMCLDGVDHVKNILVTFVLIGALTALWRAAGTIPVIVGFAATLIHPSVFLLMTFLLNCGVSVLTGTAFGTAATMGVICATMGRTMGVDPRLIGGAALSGAYFGDRCSPVSTSALLVAELTGTVIYDNLRRMVRTALVPFGLACLAFTALGLAAPRGGGIMALRALFSREFDMGWIAALPALVIMGLSLARVRVKRAMLASILAAAALCLWVQRVPAASLLRTALMGFRARDPEVARMLDGGGTRSMVRVMGIVCLSAAYSGLFAGTGLLDDPQRALRALAARTGPFAATLCTAVLANLLACNQTLAVMLTSQLCGGMHASPADFANALEDTAIVIAPLVPWSIAGAVSLSAIGAPASSLPFACYLYLVPLCHLAASLRQERKQRREAR